MKFISLQKSIIAFASMAIVTISTAPFSAHAQIPGDSYIKATITTGKGNALVNRDNRNQLLEKIQSDQSVKPLTAAQKQAALIQQLSVLIGNLQNIHDRIAMRTTQQATSGQDISGIVLLLSNASDNLIEASSSIANLTSPTSTTTSPDDIRAATINIVNLVNSAKDTLQNALDTLEQTI